MCFTVIKNNFSEKEAGLVDVLTVEVFIVSPKAVTLYASLSFILTTMSCAGHPFFTARETEAP